MFRSSPISRINTFFFALMVLAGGRAFAQTSTTTPYVFSATTVGSSANLTVTFNFAAAGTYGSAYVTTQGDTSKDFQLVSQTCGGAQAAGSTCTVVVRFQPTAIGQRVGAVILTTTSNLVAATAMVRGVGNGPQINFQTNGVINSLQSHYYGEQYVVDADGNLYFPDGYGIAKYNTSTGASSRVTNVYGGSDGRGIGIDGAGNVYTSIGTSNPYQIQRNTLNADGTYTSLVVLSSTTRINAFAIDNSGNIFYQTGLSLYALTRLTNGFYYSALVGSTATAFFNMTFDSSSNLYYTGTDDNLYKRTNNNGTYAAPVLIGPTTETSSGELAVDPAGDIFVTENVQIDKYIPSTGGTYTRTTIITDLNGEAYAAAFDPSSGRFYFGTFDATYIIKYTDTYFPPNLDFGTVNVGSTSAAQTITVQNTGTTTLTFPVPGAGSTNPNLSANWTYGGTCIRINPGGTAFTLTSGASCTQQVTFAPTVAGSLTGTLVSIDNSISGTTQTSNLTGIGQTATVTSLVPSPTSVTAGGSTTLTATITPSAGAAGYVVFSDGGNAIGSSVNTSGNTASLTDSNLTVGTHVFTAAFTPSTSGYGSSNSSSVNVVVSQATPTPAAATPATFVYGTASTMLTGTIAFPGTTPPTGAASFAIDGGTAVAATCSGSSSPLSCTATYASNGIAAGSHSLTLSVTADANFTAATSSAATFTVTQATTSTTASAPAITYGTATDALSATVPYSGTAAPSGGVKFSIDGGTGILATSCNSASSTLTCTLNDNSASLSVGNHNVSATLAADTNYTGSQSSTVQLVVSKATVTITASAPAVAYGTATDTLTATVPYTGANAPGGSVSFSVDGSTPVVAVCGSAGGTLTCTVSYPTGTLSTGSHNVSAALNADTNYNAATSQTVVLTVTAQTPSITVPAVTAMYGSANAALTAQLAYTGSGSAPSGSLLFSVNGGTAVAGACSGSSSPLTCTVSYPTAALTGGSYTITASYAANGNYAAASGTGTLTISASATALAMSVSQPSSGGVVITVALAGPPANYSSGTVTFFDGSTIVCSAVALSSAGATCATPTLSVGTHSFTATYSGDANYASSNNNNSPKIVTIDAADNTTGGSTAPGTASAPVPVQLAFGSNFTLGAINLANSGSGTTPAFTIVAGGTCSVGTAYTAGQNCTVNVVYTNPGSGLVVGTVSLVDNTSAQNVVGTATITALGSR